MPTPRPRPRPVMRVLPAPAPAAPAPFPAEELGAVLAYAHALLRADCAAEARVLCEGLVVVAPDYALAHRALAEIELSAGEVEAALRAAERAAALEPQSAQAQLGLARALIALGRGAEARPKLIAAAQLDRSLLPLARAMAEAL